MVNHGKFKYRIGLAAFLILLTGGVVLGGEREDMGLGDSGSPSASGPVEEKELLEAQGPSSAIMETHVQFDAFAGYRFISVDRSGGRAAEYEYLHSNPVLGGAANYLAPDRKFSLEGEYLNDKDYHGDLTYDFKGIYRFNLRTESLFHNLDHESLFSPPFTLHSNATNIDNIYTPDDRNLGDMYGVRVEQDLARFRYKFPLYPIHLNLGYWRMLKEGTGQLRYADQAFEGTGAPNTPVANTIFSKSGTIDRQTHEGQFGIDSHLGLVDVIYDFRIREFGEHAATPRDQFVQPRTDPSFVMQRNAGTFQHNENPDSRFYAHTIRLHTSMSGGIVGAASYTYGKQENLSNLTDFTGANSTYNIIQNVAGDFSYTPCREFSMAFKYRRVDVERNGPATLSNPSGFVVNPPVIVRPALDTLKDAITATFSYRPTYLLTLKGEYRGEFLSRENLDLWVRPGTISTFSYPDHSATHTGSLAILSRPLKGLKLRAEYLYSTTDNPAYPNAYEEKHEGTAQASYNAPNRWGATAGTQISHENSDHVTATTLNLGNPQTTYEMPRNRKVANATASLWFVPLAKLTVTGSYGLVRSSTDQAVLFVSPVPGSNDASNYTSQAQIYSVNAAYQYNDRFDLSLALQQIRSYAEFDPQYLVVGTGNTSGIQEISRIKTIESSLAARAGYRVTKNCACSLEYSFKDYDEKYHTQFNGSVNNVTLSLSAKW